MINIELTLIEWEFNSDLKLPFPYLANYVNVFGVKRESLTLIKFVIEETQSLTLNIIFSTIESIMSTTPISSLSTKSLKGTLHHSSKVK